MLGRDLGKRSMPLVQEAGNEERHRPVQAGKWEEVFVKNRRFFLIHFLFDKGNLR